VRFILSLQDSVFSKRLLTYRLVVVTSVCSLGVFVLPLVSLRRVLLSLREIYKIIMSQHVMEQVINSTMCHCLNMLV